MFKRALSSIQATIGVAPQAQAADEDVEMPAEGALPAPVQSIINDTHES